eukprot:scaffold237428_cov30-Tisochrysis_lutea.AAC.3
MGGCHACCASPGRLPQDTSSPTVATMNRMSQKPRTSAAASPQCDRAAARSARKYGAAVPRLVSMRSRCRSWRVQSRSRNAVESRLMSMESTKRLRLPNM